MASTLTSSQVASLMAQAFGYMFLAYTLLQLALGGVEIWNKAYQEGAVALVLAILKLWFISTGFASLKDADSVTPTRVGLMHAFSFLYGVVVLFQLGFYSFIIFVEHHQQAKAEMMVIEFLVLIEFILFSTFAISLNRYVSALLAQLQGSENQESVAMVIPEPKS